MEVIKSILFSLVPLLKSSDVQKLQTDIDSLTIRYQWRCFSCQAFPTQACLSEMTSVNAVQLAVNVDILVMQLKANDAFLDQLHQQQVVISELKCMVSNLSDPSQAHSVLSDIIAQFDALEKKTLDKSSAISSFLSRLKLYIASLESWEVMLTQWEDTSKKLLSVLNLIPPSDILNTLTKLKVRS